MENITRFTNHGVAVYATHEQAEAAIKSLEDSGYNMKDLSIIAKDYQTLERPVGFVNTGDRILTWGKYGAFWGSIWGLLFGSALLFIPGLGPVVFAGYIVAALEGAFLGGTLGVVGGALTSIGIPENSVVRYETALNAGSFLVFAHGSAEDVENARAILAKTPATHLEMYSAAPPIAAGRA